jgi:hypothetical protein
MVWSSVRAEECGGNDRTRPPWVSNKNDSMFMFGALVVNSPFSVN